MECTDDQGELNLVTCLIVKYEHLLVVEAHACAAAGAYPVVSQESGQAGNRMARWESPTRLAVLSYSQGFLSVISDICCAPPFPGDSPLSLVAQLLLPDALPSLFTHICSSLDSLLAGEIICVLKLSLFHPSCPPSLYPDLILSAQDALLESADCTDVCMDEFSDIRECYLTACEYPSSPGPSCPEPGRMSALSPSCHSHFDSSTSFDQSIIHADATQSPDMKEVSLSSSALFSPQSQQSRGHDLAALPSPSSHQPGIADRLHSLLTDPVETWKQCLRGAELELGSVILRKHLPGDFAFSPPVALRSIPRGSPLQEVVQWVERNVLPRLQHMTSCEPTGLADAERAVREVCDELMERASDAEMRDGHPFQALGASHLALNIASSLLLSSSPSARHVQQRADSMYSSFSLQVAVWTQWDHRLSFRQVDSSGITGVLSSRLLATSEKNLAGDLRERVRPLLARYASNVDEMVLDCLTNYLEKYVVLMSSGDGDEGRASTHTSLLPQTSVDIEDGPLSYSIHITRLVIIAAAIETPHLRAKAVISVLQAFSTGSTPPASVFEDLSVMSEGLQQQVSSGIAEALSEAFRAHKLRQLAARYQIVSFNPRDPRQVRDAVSLIMSKVHSPTAITDALCFADAYGCSGVDVSGTIVKSLLHRVLPMPSSEQATEPEGVIDRELLLKDALSLIPASRISVVVEDTCSYLNGVLDELCKEGGDRNGEISDERLCRLFASAASGALVAASFYLDNSGERRVETGTSEHLPDSLVRSPVAMLPTLSSAINQDYLTTLKRIKKLHIEFSIYLSPRRLADVKTCTEIVRLMAVAKADDILAKSLGEKGQVDSNTCRKALTDATFMNGLRKVVGLLQTSYPFALHAMVKQMQSRGQLELSMCVAEQLALEKTEVANESTCTLEAPADGDLLINAAVSICGVAARRAQDPARNKQALLKRSARRAGNTADLEQWDDELAPFSVSSDLLRFSLLDCSKNQLGKNIDLLNGCGLVLDVHDRLEDAVGSKQSSSALYGNQDIAPPSASWARSSVLSTPHSMQRQLGADSTRRNENPSNRTHGTEEGEKDQKDLVSLQQLQLRISGLNFTRDGILMSRSTIWPSLLMHIIAETKRRESLGTGGSDDKFRFQNAEDVEKLVSILQRSENHMLAVRVLLCTWGPSSPKRQSLQASLLALGRKILGYRDIDTALAVACLSAVPYDVMVKELRGAVPSIQSDFSRLRTVARVGEQLAHMWQQEELLLVFQSLQTNAKWWHVLSSYGVKIDPRTFQSSVASQREACIRAVVPSLLDKTKGDISLALEYCSQFDLEAHYASTCYIEYLLLRLPTGILSTSWADNIRSACSAVEESLIVSSLSAILPKIHPLDYEKICYTCHWVIRVISDDDGADRDNEEEDSADEQESVGRHHTPLSAQARSALKDQCTKYLHITTLLSSLTIGVPVTSAYPFLSEVYLSAPEEYSFRLPLWPMLKDPWTVLEPLMIIDAEMASKLTPLCSSLNLDRDEFYLKRAVSLYARTSGALSTWSTEKMALHPQLEALLRDVAEIASCAKRPFTKVKIWRLVYEMEKERHEEVALKALSTALGVFDAENMATWRNILSPDELQQAQEIEQETMAEMVKHLSKVELVKLDAEKARITQSQPSTHLSRPWSSLTSVVSPLLGDITAVLKTLLEMCVEDAWVMQCSYLRCTRSILCSSDIGRVVHLPAVVEYLSLVGVAAALIYDYHLKLKGSETQEERGSKQTHVGGEPPNKSAGTAFASSVLQSVRHSFIGKLLADVDVQGESAQSSRVMMSASTKGGSSGRASHQQSSVWGSMSALGTPVSPSPSEARRREDLFRSFCISSILLTCTPSCPRAVFLSQLMIVARGTTAKAQRRLTARSKYRAIQAVVFLAEGCQNELWASPDLPLASAPPMSDEHRKMMDMLSNSSHLRSLRGHLFCLAELQELRLPCSEDTLSHALGYDPSPPPPQATSANTSGCTALVNTWLRDEGFNSDVCELCRDVLLTSRCLDMQAWQNLFTHMLSRGFVRAIIHSLISIRHHALLLSSLLRDPRLVKELTECLCTASRDASEKSIQIHDVLEARDATLASVSTADKQREGKENANNVLVDDAEGTNKRQGRVVDYSSGAATEGPMRTIVLMGALSPWSIGQWDECPEDLSLSLFRIGHLWSLLEAEGASLYLEIAPKLQNVCLSLVRASSRFQALWISRFSLLQPQSPNNESPLPKEAMIVELVIRSTLFLSTCLLPAIRSSIGEGNMRERFLSRVNHSSLSRKLEFNQAQKSLPQFLVEFLSEGIGKDPDSQSSEHTRAAESDAPHSLRVLSAVCNIFDKSTALVSFSLFCALIAEHDGSSCPSSPPASLLKRRGERNADKGFASAAIPPATVLDESTRLSRFRRLVQCLGACGLALTEGDASCRRACCYLMEWVSTSEEVTALLRKEGTLLSTHLREAILATVNTCQGSGLMTTNSYRVTIRAALGVAGEE